VKIICAFHIHLTASSFYNLRIWNCGYVFTHSPELGTYFCRKCLYL